MLFGKLKNDKWGFDIFEESFTSYIKIDDDFHMQLIEKANNEGKIITGDENGFPVLTDPTQPSQIEMYKLKICELKAFLAETDWYVLRFIETGKDIPDKIKLERNTAREEISKLNNIIKS